MDKLKSKYIDPFTDFGFKKLFGEECNKDLLLDFLNELLYKKEGKIVSLSYLKSEQLGRSEEDRKAIFDLHCENEKGERFIVEMQKIKQFLYLEMPKFNKKIEELETRFEKWMYVLKNLKRLDRLPEKLREKVFEKIFSVAEIAKLTKEEYNQYVDSLKTYRDWKNSIDTARDEGEVKGKAEGKAEEKLEIAKKLKNRGMSFDQISEITNLSLEDIENISI